MPTFTPDRLTDIASRVLASAGVPADEARIVGRSLVASNLLGHDSHGVLRLPQYLGMIRSGTVKPGAPVNVVRETGGTALVDGNYGFGQVVARRATEIAIEKAATHGAGAVAVRRCGHVGRLGEYTAMAAEQGMIGMAMINNHGGGLCMAPWGGISRRLSPNPLSFAIPTGDSDPIVLDMTSSVCAEGKLRVLRNQGRAVPEGCIIDAQGRATTNPADFYGPPQGALLPLGGPVGYKGFGLCLVMDILAGALSGAGCSGSSDVMGLQGVFLTVIDVACFTTPEDFKHEVGEFIRYLKDSPRLPGVAEIVMPGEPEFREQRRRLREGISVDAETWRQIVEAARSVGLDLADDAE